MANVQQPEMRRSGHDPLVQDHNEETAPRGAPRGKGPRGPIPPDQTSPYGPQDEHQARARDEQASKR